jgi:hypothetical protein
MLDVPDTERFAMRISPELLAAIDQWRLGLLDKPPRATAIKRLIATGLEVETGKRRPKLRPKK